MLFTCILYWQAFDSHNVQVICLLQVWHPGEWRGFSDIEVFPPAISHSDRERAGSLEPDHHHGNSSDGAHGPGPRQAGPGRLRGGAWAQHATASRAVNMATHTAGLMSRTEHHHTRVTGSHGNQFSLFSCFINHECIKVLIITTLPI